MLLPLLGIERSLVALAAGYALLALLTGTAGALRLAPDPPWRSPRRSRSFRSAGHARRATCACRSSAGTASSEHAVLAVREGRSETAVYVERRLDGEPLATFLLTDGVSMSSTAVFARRYMKLFVWWPLALQQDARTALLISYGVGSTARALVDTPWLESIDVVDTSREVLALSDLLYPDPSEHPLRDPRVQRPRGGRPTLPADDASGATT